MLNKCLQQSKLIENPGVHSLAVNANLHSKWNVGNFKKGEEKIVRMKVLQYCKLNFLTLIRRCSTAQT